MHAEPGAHERARPRRIRACTIAWVAILSSLVLQANVVPAAATGLDAGHVAAALERAAELPRLYSLLVAHDGRIVVEHTVRGPGPDQPVNVKSLSKTVLAALVGAAIHRGHIEGVDQPVAELLGRRMPGGADPKTRRITVGHLLSMQAGLERTSGSNYGRWVRSGDWVAYALTRPFVDEPGGRMLYSTGSSHVLSAALTERTGRSTLELARAWLGDPLGIQVPPWLRDPQGIYFGGNEMRLSPRALVRLGELYRQDGVYGGQRILPAGWVQASWTARGHSRWTGDGYGYGWFATRLSGHPVYYGRGFGGQLLYVIPDLAMTVAITSDPSPPSPGGTYLRQLHALVRNHLIPAAEAAGSAS